MARCDQCCRATGSTFTAPSGRELCERCYGRIVRRVVRPPGRYARGWAGAVKGEAAAAEARRAKLAATKGFWRRLWVRVVG